MQFQQFALLVPIQVKCHSHRKSLIGTQEKYLRELGKDFNFNVGSRIRVKKGVELKESKEMELIS